MTTLKQHQPPMTVDEQIQNLLDNNLTIMDKIYAEKILNQVSYFRLIKAYSLGLKQENGSYHDGITFENIVDLYNFNTRFRQLLLTQIEKIEVKLRCVISNYFSNKYGVLGYFKKENFKDQHFHNTLIDEVNTAKNKAFRSPFVENFTKNYSGGQLPLYALVEIMNFGSLSKMFKNMLPQDKKEISKAFNITYTYLESWLECIAYIRNICAHYGRLYNTKLTKTPRLYKDDIKNKVNNNRIFSVLVCIKHLSTEDINQWDMFVDDICTLKDKYESVDLATMGFITGWQSYLHIRNY